LVIVGGGGGGGGSGYHNNNTRPRFPGGAASTSWASSTINSSSYYTNQSTLTFRAYDANGANPVSGRIGADRGANADGGGGGGGGGGFTGGSGGGNAGGDVNAPGGSGGTSAYNSSFFSAAPGLSTGYSGGAAGGANNNGSTGSATITVIFSGGGTTGSNPSTGGVNSADHNGNWGVLRGSANQFLSESINHHITTGTAQNLGITLPSGTITMSTRSRSTFDNYLNFYMRNNEPIPIQQPYFRLKYLIKAF
jgi:hypothetical protein